MNFKSYQADITIRAASMAKEEIVTGLISNKMMAFLGRVMPNAQLIGMVD